MPLSVYQFHHAVGHKRHEVAELINHRHHPHLEEELTKCVMLCSNCHNILHDGAETAAQIMSLVESKQ